MSSGKRISVSIQPLHYADIPACARITSSAFSVDPHTIVKGLGREPFDMYTISRSGFFNTLDRKNYIYVKAVDDETGEIVGHAGWSFRGLDPGLIPWVGPGDTKPMAEEREKGQEKGEIPKDENKKDDGEVGKDSIDRLHALEDADMQYWLSNLVSADMPCVIIIGLIVSPSYQSRGVGSALIQHGNHIADDLGLSVWVHSSHQAYEAYKKYGFEAVRELDINLDEYAPRGPEDGEEVMGEKGSGSWGSCTTFVESLDGEDGFPEGACTNFEDQSASPYSSFMINTVDLGCSITIYGHDTNELICSSDLTIEASQGKCYNSSWQYYSVDLCTPLLPSSSSTLPSTSDVTQIPSQIAAPPNDVNVAAVAGGSVAGSLGMVAIVAAAAYYLWWRPKMRKSQPAQNDDTERDKASGFTYGSEELGAARIEAPWQSERPWELSPSHIVEAPWQSQRPFEVAA
ncbi:acyl-CoA N-acyltransferase [Hypoxylon cercidicola]|nr:acyl-CoA N-acyltransferase [Hypoxylon cercidicola]